jgi:hypothetical protein
VQELERLEGETARVRDSLDPELAGRLGPWLDESLLPRLRERRERLAALADGGALAAVLSEVSDLEAALGAERDDLTALRLIAERRADPELATTHAAADRLVREVHEPLASFAARSSLELAVGPPIPVVWQPRGNEPLLRSSLGASLLPVPGAVRLQPWLWPSLGHSLGRYLQAAIPDLRPELHEKLRLDARDEPLAPDSPALARVLFGAWSETLLADFAGALLFGPAYLRTLARSQTQDDPLAVATIALDRGGALHPTPPAHARVRLTGRWLAQMGLESTALGIVGDWDAAHGNPVLFHFSGRGGPAPIPAGPLLAHLESIADQADILAFSSLARTELSDLPGLEGWSGLAGPAGQVARALAEGTPRPAPARALLAGAALAAFEKPAAAAAIDRALRASLAGERPKRGRRRPAARAASPRHTRGRQLGTSRLTEALLLGDVLLSRRRIGRAPTRS